MLAESYPQTAVPVVEHLAGHQGVKDGSTCEGYAEVEAKQPPVLCVFVEHHEVSFGVQHAGAVGVVSVSEGDDVKADGLGNGQDQRKHPDGYYLDDGE